MGKNSYDSNYVQLSNRQNQFTEMEIKIAVALERWGWRYGSTRKSQENFLGRRVWVHLLKLSKYTLENDLISPSEFRSVKKKIHQRENTKHKDIQLAAIEDKFTGCRKQLALERCLGEDKRWSLHT